MQTAGSGPESPSTVIFAKLQATASGHPGNLGLNRVCPKWRRGDCWVGSVMRLIAKPVESDQPTPRKASPLRMYPVHNIF